MATSQALIHLIKVDGEWTGDPSDLADFDVSFTVGGQSGDRLRLLDLKKDDVELRGVTECCDLVSHVDHHQIDQFAEPSLPTGVLSPSPFSPSDDAEAHDDGVSKQISKQIVDNVTLQRPPSNPDDCVARRISMCENSSKLHPETLHVPRQQIESSSPTNLDDTVKLVRTHSPEIKPDLPTYTLPPDNTINSELPPEHSKSVMTKHHRKPIPVSERPPWRSAGAGDIPDRGRQSHHEKSKERKVSHSADARLRETKTLALRHKSASPTRNVKTVSSMGDLHKHQHRSGQNCQPRSGMYDLHGQPLFKSHNTNDMSNNPFQTGSVVRHQCTGGSSLNIGSMAGPLESANAGSDVMHGGPMDQNMFTPSSKKRGHKFPKSTFALETEDLFYSPALPNLYQLESPATPGCPTHFPGDFKAGERRLGSGHMDRLNGIAIEATGDQFTLDNETLWVALGSTFPSIVTFSVRIGVKAIAHPKGGFQLSIPGLPRGSKDWLDGSVCRYTFNIKETSLGESNNKDKLKLVQEQDGTFLISEIPKRGLRGDFSLDDTLKLHFVRFEPTKYLAANQFLIKSRVDQKRTSIGDCTIFTATCLLTPSKFLFWSDCVSFDVQVHGGPSGQNIKVFLAPGYRRLQLPRCEVKACNELRLTVSCPTTEWNLPFVISWETPGVVDGLQPSIGLGEGSIGRKSLTIKSPLAKFQKSVKRYERLPIQWAEIETVQRVRDSQGQSNVDLFRADTIQHYLGDQSSISEDRYYTNSEILAEDEVSKLLEEIRISGPNLEFVSPQKKPLGESSKLCESTLVGNTMTDNIQSDRIDQEVSLIDLEEPKEMSQPLAEEADLLARRRKGSDEISLWIREVSSAESPKEAVAGQHIPILPKRAAITQQHPVLRTLLHVWRMFKKMICAIFALTKIIISPAGLAMVWAVWITLVVIDPDGMGSSSRSAYKKTIDRFSNADYQHVVSSWFPGGNQHSWSDIMDFFPRANHIEDATEAQTSETDTLGDLEVGPEAGGEDLMQQTVNKEKPVSSSVDNQPEYTAMRPLEEENVVGWPQGIIDAIDRMLGWPGPPE